MEIWTRLPEETNYAWGAFLHYRDTPPSERSYRATAAAMNTGTSTVAEWGTKFRWIERVTAYDQHADSRMVEYRLVTSAEAVERYITTTTAVVAKVNDAVQQMVLGLQAKIDSGEATVNELSKLIGAIDRLDTLQRRLYGLPTNYRVDNALARDDAEGQVYVIGGDDG